MRCKQRCVVEGSCVILRTAYKKVFTIVNQSMNPKKLSNHLLVILSLCSLLLGIALVVWLIGNMPGGTAAAEPNPSAQTTQTDNPTDIDEQGESTSEGTSLLSNSIDSSATNNRSVVASVPPIELYIGITTDIPARIITATGTLEHAIFLSDYDPADEDPTKPAALYFDLNQRNSTQSYRYTFAAATRFDIIEPEIEWQALINLWKHSATANEQTATSEKAAETAEETAATTLDDVEDEADIEVPFTQIAILTDTLPLLRSILGQPGKNVIGYANNAELTEAAWQEISTLVLMPFESLEPRLAVLAINGQTPVENANKFDESSYPLVATLYAHRSTQDLPSRQAAEQFLANLPSGNRDPAHLTVVAMTGVTAMVRLTAAEMDKRGYGWPAEVVGPELASADITAISNEVPFVPGCKTDTRMDNLTFCSKPEYMEALTQSGVDIIGLTGNHQNDFGRTDAVTSLEIYDEAGLPVYGGGRNKQEAFAPLYIEHNGNRLAFLGANSYGPRFAWATDDQPGSAEFDLNIMSATIRNIKELDRANVVLAELQYQETYNVVPLVDQRQNFNALLRAGADIVTGVQSHVPQAMEFTDGKLILYGLGNLFFDQMWSQATREGLIVKHTIYNNRHISTQVFTTLLYDYGQPQWTTVEEHRAILNRVFGASYW